MAKQKKYILTDAISILDEEGDALVFRSKEVLTDYFGITLEEFEKWEMDGAPWGDLPAFIYLVEENLGRSKTIKTK